MQSDNVSNRTQPKEMFHHPIGEEVDRPVFVLATDYAPGYSTGRHWHERDQLVYASSGVMKVSAERGTWVVPQERAVWIPAHLEHEVLATGPVSMRSLFILPGSIPGLPTDCGVVGVSPLLRELIARAVAIPADYEGSSTDARIMDLILHELVVLPEEPLHLPEPQDSRLQAIAASLRETPADRRTLEDWGYAVGASSRTLARMFVKETGMTFRLWQRQARLLESLVRLADGQPVTSVALDVGYESPSAFVAMFKLALGVTPGQYFDGQRSEKSG